jgi:antitoxin (DNA-binding transcriptional repressor) of toxin-antitoxin stability system
MYFNSMQATLTELQRASRKVMRPVAGGKSVTLTEHGRLVARISPEYERREVSLEEFRQSEISDQAILDAIAEARE